MNGPANDALVNVDGVEKVFRRGSEDIHVLKDLHLKVPAGEFLALMGPSGSGKSTLLNLIGGLDRPTNGTVSIAGERVDELSDRKLAGWRARHIGFVFQSFHLLPYATVLENVLLPTLYREKAMDGARERAVELLRLIGLEARMRFRPNRLSGGEQQRVAICRALMNDPELLLADEPTGQLDSRTAGEIMDLLAKMNERGKTVIVVTHDPAIAAFAKRIIRIKDGVIVDEQAD